MAGNYTVSDQQKKQFASIFVLEYMINKPSTFAVFLSEQDSDLEPILENLMVEGLVDIEGDKKYIPNAKGREALTNFLSRYSEYLNMFDIYCALDLQEGEFAFSSYFDFDDDSQWRSFLHQKRWEDLRVAVASYKKMNPLEIVFMSYIREDRFGKDETGWQFDLLLGSVWDEILEICNTAISWQELGYEDDQGSVAAEKVIEDIIVHGAKIMVDLHEKEANLAPPIDHGDSDGDAGFDDYHYVDEVIIEEPRPDYYHRYYDPFYISPYWRTA